jgi:hypothetical protein
MPDCKVCGAHHATCKPVIDNWSHRAFGQRAPDEISVPAPELLFLTEAGELVGPTHPDRHVKIYRKGDPVPLDFAVKHGLIRENQVVAPWVEIDAPESTDSQGSSDLESQEDGDLDEEDQREQVETPEEATATIEAKSVNADTSRTKKRRSGRNRNSRSTKGVSADRR